MNTCRKFFCHIPLNCCTWATEWDPRGIERDNPERKIGTFFLKKLILLDVQVVGAKGSNVWSLVFYWDISISDRDLICSWHIRAVKSTIFDKELNLPSKKNATHEESRSVCFGEISWNTLRSVDGRRIYLFWEIQFVYKLCDPKSYNDPLIINSIISNHTSDLLLSTEMWNGTPDSGVM